MMIVILDSRQARPVRHVVAPLPWCTGVYLTFALFNEVLDLDCSNSLIATSFPPEGYHDGRT